MTRRRNVAKMTIALCLAAGAAHAQESMPPPTQPASENATTGAARLDPAAVDVLKRAQELLGETNTVELTISSEINADTGVLAAFKLGADGNAWLRRNEAGTWTRTMIGNADNIGGSEQISFTVIKEGDKASWIDVENKEVVHAVGRYAKGSVYSSAELLGLHYLFASSKPYAKELGAAKLESLGTEVVEGTLCDVIRAEYVGPSLPLRWYISSADGFPRKIVEELMEDATRDYEFSAVAINSEISDERFEIDAPESYAVRNLPERQGVSTLPNLTGSQEAEPSQTADGRAYAPEVGKAAPPFTGADIFGESVSLGDFEGKPVALVFWASWVPGSIDVVDEIVDLDDHAGDDAQLVTFTLRERNPEDAVNMLLERDREDVIVLTTGGRISTAYNIARMPVVMVLDADHNIVFRDEEYKKGETIKNAKAKLDEVR
ncbi:MAG: hypothetical protein ED559_12920 [Phycisphaera sp.]|nr:MAG: hypothetical protein ED559_12920 [Phycisphaera sp.]